MNLDNRKFNIMKSMLLRTLSDPGKFCYYNYHLKNTAPTFIDELMLNLGDRFGGFIISRDYNEGKLLFRYITEECKPLVVIGNQLCSKPVPSMSSDFKEYKPILIGHGTAYIVDSKLLLITGTQLSMIVDHLQNSTISD